MHPSSLLTVERQNSWLMTHTQQKHEPVTRGEVASAIIPGTCQPAIPGLGPLIHVRVSPLPPPSGGWSLPWPPEKSSWCSGALSEQMLPVSGPWMLTLDVDSIGQSHLFTGNHWPHAPYVPMPDQEQALEPQMLLHYCTELWSLYIEEEDAKSPARCGCTPCYVSATALEQRAGCRLQLHDESLDYLQRNHFLCRRTHCYFKVNNQQEPTV